MELEDNFLQPPAGKPPVSTEGMNCRILLPCLEIPTIHSCEEKGEKGR